MERGEAQGKKHASVAVARKLSVLLHRLWMTGEVYEPFRKAPQPEVVHVADLAAARA